ncbi:MAG: polymer-forming cytoskeletal protein [Treponemataceae bacterium]|nr:polymer-forming cytoskeletal protein [Treponemataceae bacterium]
MSILSDDITINTMVGNGTFVSGNLQVEGFIRVDGNIDGNVTTNGKIIIGNNAKIRGNVNAKSVISGGLIEGDIVAPDSVQLFSSAVVLGDIISKKLKADQNSIIQGYCLSVNNDDEFEELKNRWIDQRAIADKNIFGKIK